MNESGFDEKEREQALLACRFCPMCHNVDLVTAITRRETTSPRGRGVTLFALEKGLLEWDASIADVMYAFSADGLSKHVCAGHIDHDALIIDGRRRLVAAGLAPESVGRVKQNIEATGNPWGAEEPDLAALLGIEENAGAETLLYLGPAARIHRQDSVRAAAKLLRKVGISFRILAPEGDPGLLLHQLGHSDSMETFRESVRATGASRVVTIDADAYRVLKGGSLRVEHLCELLAPFAADGRLSFTKPPGKIAYHDPCSLARFAPCIDPPRALIRAIADQDPIELPWSRDRASCSGECGGLPFTNESLARAAAELRLREADGVRVLVTSSPAAAHQLAGGNTNGITIQEISEFAAGCLKED